MSELSAQTAVGFIGLGMMGHGMAKNIVEKSYALNVYANQNRAPVEDLVGRGAVESKSIAELARRSDVVFLCVTGSTQVEALVQGPDGLGANLKAGSVVVDCSSSDPNSTVKLAAELKSLGIDYADAPLSRTPKEAWEGTLDTMVGAEDQVFERLAPILGTWAGKIVHIGGVGDGHRMKLLNNFISLGYGAIYAEALALAERVGISADRVDQVIRGGRMDCGFYQTFMRFTLEGDREAHKFSLSNAFKDLRYLESMADGVGLVNPVGNAVKNSYGVAIAAGGAEDYVPMLPAYIDRLNGKPK
jgi:3-hydroxyisobutyrate dehydrogenase-like beta-hydroxyacid dehydrogenase